MQAERITSAQNPLIRHIKKLQTSRSYRMQCGEFVADGFKLLNEALKWYPRLKTVIVTDAANCPELPKTVRLVEIPQSLMQSVSSMKTPQGVIFTCDLPKQMQAAIEPGMLLLDRIQDPGNLGTILRTADAFGVKVLLGEGCADPYSEKTVRASMGAVLRSVPQSVTITQLLSSGVPVAATALSNEAVDIRSINLRDYVVVIGSEGQGICKELLAAADRCVIIPMQERCESLNAGIAAGIVLWQMRK